MTRLELLNCKDIPFYKDYLPGNKYTIDSSYDIHGIAFALILEYGSQCHVLAYVPRGGKLEIST